MLPHSKGRTQTLENPKCRRGETLNEIVVECSHDGVLERLNSREGWKMASVQGFSRCACTSDLLIHLDVRSILRWPTNSGTEGGRSRCQCLQRRQQPMNKRWPSARRSTTAPSDSACGLNGKKCKAPAIAPYVNGSRPPLKAGKKRLIRPGDIDMYTDLHESHTGQWLTPSVSYTTHQLQWDEQPTWI